MTVNATPDRFYRIGDHLATDFVNTVYDPDHPTGSLRSAKDVIAFLVTTGSIEAGAATELRRTLSDVSVAKRWFDRAITLRAAIAESLYAFEARRTLPQPSIEHINEILRSAAGYESLVPRTSTSIDLQFVFITADPAAALVPVAHAAAELLANSRSPVRKCANPECVRHFVDDSRTGRRRWCDMAVCGNRAKVTAFLERKRSVAAKPPSEVDKQR
jgi:predicted RNA-binding Zn ribbon-like protein